MFINKDWWKKNGLTPQLFCSLLKMQRTDALSLYLSIFKSRLWFMLNNAVRHPNPLGHTGLERQFFTAQLSQAIQGLNDTHLNQAPPSRVKSEPAEWCHNGESSMYSWTHQRWGHSTENGAMFVYKFNYLVTHHARFTAVARQDAICAESFYVKYFKRLVTNIQYWTQGSNMFRKVKAFHVRQSWTKRKKKMAQSHRRKEIQ